MHIRSLDVDVNLIIDEFNKGSNAPLDTGIPLHLPLLHIPYWPKMEKEVEYQTEIPDEPSDGWERKDAAWIWKMYGS
jgi:hypothetical protein